MQRNKRKPLFKGAMPLLFLLIGGSVFLLLSGLLLQHSFSMFQKASPAQTPPSTITNNTLSIQAHTIASTTGADRTPISTPTPKATNQPLLSPTAQATSIPLGNTLPPGSTLPSDSVCAARVSRSSFEPRSDNATANHQVPGAAQIANLQPWDPSIGMDTKSDSLRKRITGNFTGTTDEILQWGACKWGIDPNIIRAQAVSESNWHQSQLGDITSDQSVCPPGTWNGGSCYQSYGILQIKYRYFKTEWPMSRDDTAFNVDMVYGWIRNCYEGWSDYLYQQTSSSSYHAGDIWGCLGFWYSGSWYTSGAINYINVARDHYTQKPWLQVGF